MSRIGSWLCFVLLAVTSIASAAAVLDVVETPGDFYTLTARDDADPGIQYWACKVDIASGGIFSFVDLTDGGDGVGGHTDYQGANAYNRQCTLLFFDGRGGNVGTRNAALASLADRLSYSAAPDGSSFTISYVEDASSAAFFNNSYPDGAISLSPGDLLTTITVVIRPPTVNGTAWDWSIVGQNVSGHGLSPKVWAAQYVRTYLLGTLVKTADSEDSLLDGPFNPAEPVSFMRQTLGDNAALGLTTGRQIINDYQGGFGGQSAGGSIALSSWAGYDIMSYTSPFSYAADKALPAGESRTDSGQLIIDIAAECAGCPIADAGPDQSITATTPDPQPVTLDGSGSTDADGTIVSYTWYELGQAIATGVNPTIQLSPGTHYIDLTVVDDSGEVAVDSIVIDISLQGADRIFYIDFDGGDDTSHGRSPSAAWKHAPGDADAAGLAAGTVPAAGDLLIFKGGVHYRGSIDIPSGGDPGKHVVYDGNSAGAFGEGRAIIDGSEALGPWTPCASADECGGNPDWQKIWKAQLPAGVTIFTENMYQDDQLLWMAQDPNIPDPQYYDDLSTFITCPLGNATDTSLTDTGYFTQSEPDAWDGAYIHIWINPNIVVSKLITGYDPATSTVRFADVGGGGVYTDRDSLYAAANAFRCLDTPGEYVIDEANATVYLRPLDDADPNACEISASVRMNGLDLRGHSYVTVQGFKIIRHSSPLNASRNGCGIRNYIDGATDVLIRDNEVTQQRSMEKYGGIYLTGVSDSLVTGNYVHHNVRNRGIMCSGVNNEVSDNLLISNGGTGIYTPGSIDTRILRNTVLDHTGVHANGITLYQGCTNCTVMYNVVKGGLCAYTTQDANGIFTAYNIFSSASDGYTVADWSGGTHTSTNLTLVNNVIMNPAGGTAMSLGSQSRTGLVVRNNIIDGAGDLSSDPGASNNLYTSLSWNQNASALETGSIYQPDKALVFVDAAVEDYRLVAGSPAIDAGVDVGLSFDLDDAAVPQGAGVDIGAYEFASALKPGDANGDDAVDIQDFVILKQNYGAGGGAVWAQGDFNGDGNVDIQDFVILKQNYGS